MPRKSKPTIDGVLLGKMVEEMDDARLGLKAAMERDTQEDRWRTLALTAMATAHNVLVWVLHEPPFKPVHAVNWRRKYDPEEKETVES